MSMDLFKNIDVNVLQEQFSDRFSEKEMSKRLHHNDVIDSHGKQSEDSVSRNSSLVQFGYSADSSYSADDEDSDIETIYKFKKDSAQKSNDVAAVKHSVSNSHAEKFNPSTSSSDSSPCNHSRFVKRRKGCECSKSKIVVSHSRKPVSKAVHLLPSEKLINSLVVRVSAIKLSSDTVQSYKRNDDEMDIDCPTVTKPQKTQNKIMKRKIPKHSLRQKSVLKVR